MLYIQVEWLINMGSTVFASNNCHTLTICWINWWIHWISGHIITKDWMNFQKVLGKPNMNQNSFYIVYTLDRVKGLKELWDKIQFLQTAFTFEHLFPKLQKTHISIDKFSFCYYLDLFMNSFNFRTHNQQELDGFLKGIGKTYHKDFVFLFYKPHHLVEYTTNKPNIWMLNTTTTLHR